MATVKVKSGEWNTARERDNLSPQFTNRFPFSVDSNVSIRPHVFRQGELLGVVNPSNHHRH
jgi:hypothetical protein